jgi:SMODS and SLOG-associating 2TM effector domain 2
MPLETDLRNCPEPERNIVFHPLPPLSWGQNESAASARRLAEYVSCEAQVAIGWYLDRKQLTKRWARRLRLVAILGTAAAGLIPLLSELFRGLPALWGSVALIVAATAVGLDRFFGFSSAWMRFLTTEMEIRHHLHRFLLDWEEAQARLAGTPPDALAAQRLIQLCRGLIEALNGILRTEMGEWVSEFRQNLAQVDQAAKVQAQTLGLGAANLLVTNGEQCPDGWELSLDDGPPIRRHGKTAALGGLTAGPHILRVSGVLDGRTVQGEIALMAAGGRMQEVSLTLA